MLLAVSPLAGFSGFLQILLIILSGILCTSFIITVIAHYRKRKEKELEPEAVQQILASSPENVGYRLDNDYLLIDHSGLIRDYKSKLVNYHARYTALKQDFAKLEDKYNSLLIQKDSGNPKTNTMEPTSSAATAEFKQELEIEKQGLLAQVAQLNLACRELEKDKASLLAKLEMAAAPDHEKNEKLEQWLAENQQLKSQLAEQGYLKDLLGEKEAQISFLQEKLEQRIRHFHQSEQQLNGVREQVEQQRKLLDESRTELETAQQNMAAMQTSLESNNEILKQKNDHIVYLENTLNEIREQNEMLNAAVADETTKLAQMEEILEQAKERSQYAEQRLQANKELMQRLYNEFSQCMAEPADKAPLVVMHPSANLEQWEEPVAQS